MTADLRYRVAPQVGPRVESLGELLWDAMRQHKSLVAMIEADRKREVARYTYAEAAQRAGRIAKRMQDLGVGQGDRVAILMTNQPAWLLTALAALRRGAVLVPLDYKLEVHDQRALIAHSKPKLLVTEHSIWRKLGPVEGPTIWVSEAPQGGLPAEDPRVSPFEDLPEGEGAEIPCKKGDLAAIVYSSGTGGRPKGCMLTHGSYLAQLSGLLDRFPMAPGDVYFSVLPTNHAIDFMVGFVGPLVCGATVVHQRTLRPEMLRFTMSRYGVTIMSVVPLLLTAFERAVRERLDELNLWQRAAVDTAIELNRALTESGPNEALSRRLLSPLHAAFGGRLRLLICGGAPTDRRRVEFFGSIGIPVVIGYGLTEACTAVTVCSVRPMRSDTVGSPLASVHVEIDSPGEDGVGEVCVSGPTLMRGYLDDPEMTAEVMRDGRLHTGDLGFIDASGHLHLVGRLKDMLVSPGGKNVYPEDIEFAFSDIDGVEEVAVVTAGAVWPELHASGDLPRESLLLVVRSDYPLGELSGVLAERNRRLLAYKRVSAVLVWPRAFPRTASMKLKRKDLLLELASARRDALRPLAGPAKGGLH